MGMVRSHVKYSLPSWIWMGCVFVLDDVVCGCDKGSVLVVFVCVMLTWLPTTPTSMHAFSVKHNGLLITWVVDTKLQWIWVPIFCVCMCLSNLSCRSMWAVWQKMHMGRWLLDISVWQWYNWLKSPHLDPRCNCSNDNPSKSAQTSGPHEHCQTNSPYTTTKVFSPSLKGHRNGPAVRCC